MYITDAVCARDSEHLNMFIARAVCEAKKPSQLLMSSLLKSVGEKDGLEEQLVDDDPKTGLGFIDGVFIFGYFKDMKDIVRIGLHYLDNKHFPQHFMFANFQCLRCGLCCKNYECVEVESKLVARWEAEGRDDILQYFVVYARSKNGHVLGEISPRGETGCPLCRKIPKKPYCGCKIRDVKEHIPICKAYLCSKSLPVAHMNFANVQELIELIGLKRYYSLVERDWGEDFDYSKCWIKTHKRISAR